MNKFYSYIKTNRDAFISKVEVLASALGILPEWLFAVMFIESGLNEKAYNSTSGATGLIQFMPTTAASLGTSTTALYNMSNVNQLDYVYTYLKPYAGRMHSLYDVYFAVFFPAAIGKADNYVLQTSTLSASKIASQNAVYDLNKDNQITVSEVKAAITDYLKKKSITMRL